MKMKPSKWLKWKIGAVGLLGLVILFHEVKASTAFEQAYANASPTKDSQTNLQGKKDSVLNEWQQSRQSTPSTNNSSSSSRKHRQSGESAQRSGSTYNGGTNTSPSPGDSSGITPNARTSRS